MNMQLLIFLLVILLGSCSGEVDIEKDPVTIKEDLIKTHQNLHRQEEQDIDAYAKRRNLNMKISGTGLRYLILKDGEGEKAVKGDLVTVNYRVELLDGTLCYSSDKKGVQTFTVEKDQVESGIHEGIKLLAQGGKAKFILPSHLAYGLTGDQDKIPPQSPVVYDIELIEILKNEK
jgi:FKBP-type peptidyl-prolyl cis-trans isomerase FkpA